MVKTHLKVVLTGGGTAGHIMPHIAMIPLFRKAGHELVYIGTNGMEQDLISPHGIPFRSILGGKLRRYVSLENILDVFKVLIGFFQSFFWLLVERPDVVFSKGGFVSVPVCYAAKCLRIPIVTHESDLTPGLANRMIAPLADVICAAFPQSLACLPRAKTCLTGLPVRPFILEGVAQEGFRYTGFRPDDPRKVLLVMGGSQGAQALNETLVKVLPELLQSFRVIHLCGKGKKPEASFGDGYACFEFLHDELPHIFAMTDFVISRAGANAIFEFLSLSKPMLLIPLEKGSRGDQWHNARAFSEKGAALVLREKDLSPASFLEHIQRLVDGAEAMRGQQKHFIIGDQDASHAVFSVIEAAAKKQGLPCHGNL